LLNFDCRLKIGDVEHFDEYQEERFLFNNQKATINNFFSKSPSSSNKTRTADISACSGSRAA